MKNLVDKEKIKEYNDIPVAYCSSCHSLKIMITDSGESFCDICGNTEIKTAHIEEWLEEENLNKESNGK